MSTPCLLFVDDEPNVLRALRRIFIDDDFEIELAANGEEALAYLQDHTVDLILSDHNMPAMSGIEFLERTKELQPDCIRMLITGRGDLEIALDAINKGNIYKFFNKPWEDDHLHIAVIRALEYKHARELARAHEEQIARYQSYRQTMVTVSHYINNFNCGLMMSVDNLRNSQNLPEKEKAWSISAVKSAEKIQEVLRILNQQQEIKIADYPMTDGMIDIDQEVQEAIKRIDDEYS